MLSMPYCWVSVSVSLLLLLPRLGLVSPLFSLPFPFPLHISVYPPLPQASLLMGVGGGDLRHGNSHLSSPANLDEDIWKQRGGVY